MAALEIHCLGGFAVGLHKTAIPAFPTDKIRALLTYLALEGGQPHRREVLANLFWPEMDEAGALMNLRLALHRLRKTLDNVQPAMGAALLQSTRQTLQLNSALVTVDVNRFQALLTACAVHLHESLLSCPDCRSRLQQAVELYRGELLAGFGLGDAPVFEEWLLLRREALHQQALAALHTLVLGYEQQGDDVQAHYYASRQLALDPTREEAHRHLLRSLARRGLRTEALAQYESCRRILQIELGVDPAPETVALYEEILAKPDAKMQGRLEQNLALPPSAVAALPGTLADWRDVPEATKVYGRAAELAQLGNWLVYERCTLVALLGIGGVGKTTLAAATAKTVAANFERVIWRSLLNAPPLEELLRDLLQRLSNAQLIDLPQSLDGQLLLLLEALRRQRSLLILDNMESIMHPAQPGQMRPGYTGYAHLLRRIVTQGHQSCLLLTSRERPQDFARWEEDTPRVRSLLLGGLDETAGQTMLTARGLLGPQADAVALVHRYSGNPLALRLVAQTVQDLFGGSIAAFLATETSLFDDIQAVLDQQFTRLSPLEQELLLWLAIEREPVSLQSLRDNLVDPGAPRALVEALRALQRRSLIGQSAQHFVLQNVVTEYLTEHLVAQVYQEICEFSWLISTVTGERPSAAPPTFKVEIQHLWLNRFALLKATAKEYVRASQERLIVQPLLKRLLQKVGHDGLVKQINQAVTALHTYAPLRPGYMAGNLLNLLLHLGVELRGYDFSYLNVWQAHLQMMRLPEVNFRGANLAHSGFTHLFGEIFALQFQQGTQLLVAGSVDGVLYVWGASALTATGRLLYEYQTFGAGATIASFDASGRFLASGHTNRQVLLWDVTQGRLLHALAEPVDAVWFLLFSPTAETLAVSSADGTVRLWDVQTGELKLVLQAHRIAIPTLAFSPDGRMLASGDVDGTICLWRLTADFQAGLLATLHGHTDEVHNLAFDPSGTLLASGSHDNTVRLWRVSSAAGVHLLHKLQGHALAIRALALSPDGTLLASGGEDTYVRLWDIQTGQLLHTFFDLGYPSAALVFSQDGRRLASAAREQIVFLWEVATRQRLNSLQAYSNQVYAARFSTDGRWLAAGGLDGALHLWTITSHHTDNTVLAVPAQSLRGHTRSLYAVAVAPDAAATYPLVATAGADQTIRLWDIASHRTLAVLAGHTDKVEAIDFSPDGQSLVSASRDKCVKLWDVACGQVRHTLQGHTDRVLSCAFSPTGRLVASGGADRTVRLWDAQQGTALYTLQGHQNTVRSVIFSRDGQLLISSSYDHTLRFWDTQTGQQTGIVTTWGTSILSIDYHPQRALLALGANDHMVRLWAFSQQPGEGRLLAILRGHTNSVFSVQFSLDGHWLVSAGADETIRLWQIAPLLTTPLAENQPPLALPMAHTFDPCIAILRAEGPYAGMNITDVTGINEAQKATLKALGAVDDEMIS